MKKTIFLLSQLIQVLMLTAQTTTAITPNGKKVSFDPKFVNTADNGLTQTGLNLQLNGTLTKATIITTDTKNTLSIRGLQIANSLTDNVNIVDLNGILKTVSTVSLMGSEPWYNIVDNTPATSNTQNIYQIGNVGIGQNNPVAKLDVKSTVPGTAFVLQDGTQKNGFVLKGDANGVGNWQANDIAVNIVNGNTTTVPVGFTGNLYSNCYITLPIGSWAVYVGLLINNKSGNTPANNTYYSRFTLSSSNGSVTTTGCTFIDANSIIYNFGNSGNVPYPSSVMFVNGCIRVNVTTAQTLYLWDIGCSTNTAIKNDLENFIYAMKVQ